ncbi:ABC transporter permease, partial [Selenomonas sp.]|uniref:ABC transporter permease n=1 Tax=Selenomonas sp. TaxID=2053611 RepID=UPI003FA32B46
MFSEMIRLFQERSDFFLQLTLEHIAISLVAIVLAIVIGGAMGILIAEIDRIAQPTLLVVNFLYTIPSIAMFGFLLPFSGIGNTTAIIALTLYALLPMVKNTHTGLKNVDPLLIEAAVGMGSTRFQVLRRIALPLAMPVILAGIRNMTTMTIALAGIAS